MASVRVKLTVPEHLIQQPIIGRLAREFDVLPNIRRASVDDSVGWLMCELVGEPPALDRAIAWLQELGVQVDLLGEALES